MSEGGLGDLLGTVVPETEALDLPVPTVGPSSEDIAPEVPEAIGPTIPERAIPNPYDLALERGGRLSSLAGDEVWRRDVGMTESLSLQEIARQNDAFKALEQGQGREPVGLTSTDVSGFIRFMNGVGNAVEGLGSTLLRPIQYGPQQPPPRQPEPPPIEQPPPDAYQDALQRERMNAAFDAAKPVTDVAADATETTTRITPGES